MNVLFRMDGGAVLGLGHLVRCRILADVFRRNGWKVLFAVREGVEKLPILATERENIFFVPAGASVEEDCRFVRKIAVTHEVDVLVADICHELNMAEEEALVKALRGLCGQTFVCAVIDDFKICPVPADVHLVPYYGAEPLKENACAGSRILIGSEFHLFSDEFRAAAGKARDIRREAENVLVTFGGSDRAQLTEMVVKALLAVKEAQLKIAVLAASTFGEKRLEALRRVESENQGRVSLVVDADNMPERLAAADVVMTSGGLTKYEAALMGTPSLMITQFPLESERAEVFARAGAAVHLGSPRALKKDVALAVQDLLADPAARAVMSSVGRSLMGHGDGAEKVFNAIQEIVRDHEKRN